MDAIEKAIAVLRQQGRDIEEGIAVLTRIQVRGNAQTHTPTTNDIWTPERRKAAGRRAKAAWRKRKALKAQNRAKVTTVAPKKKG